jgi:hypothetical protein
MIMLRDRFKFQEREPECGPGRVDTFNPPKVLLNFRMDLLPTNEWVGNCALPSIWYQNKRKGMWLHWDGNNDSVAERNRSAAFGTGATPPTLDRVSMSRTEDWLSNKAAPPILTPSTKPSRPRANRFTRNTAPNATGQMARILPANMLDRSRPLKPWRRTGTGLTLTVKIYAPTKICSIRLIPKSGFGIFAKRSATPISRWTVSGCARRICTTVRCRRCGICLNLPQRVPKFFIAAAIYMICGEWAS